MELCSARSDGGGEALCLGFVAGVADSMAPGTAVAGKTACLPDEVEIGQAGEVVVTYLYKSALNLLDSVRRNRRRTALSRETESGCARSGM